MSDPYSLTEEKLSDINLEETRPLRDSVDIPEREQDFGASPLDGFFKKFESIQNDFQTYLALSKLLKEKRKEEIESNSTSESDKVSQDARNMLFSIKTDLQELVEYCNANPVEPNDSQIRILQLNSLKKKLLKAIEDSQRAENDFRVQLKNRSMRQFMIAYPDATEDEINIALDNGDLSFFSQSLVDSTRVESASDTLKQVQERHLDIKRIENSVIELQTLYSQLQDVIELQAPLIEKIDEDLTAANRNLEEADAEIIVATKTAKSTQRKKRLIFGFILVVLILLVAAFSVYFIIYGQKKTA